MHNGTENSLPCLWNKDRYVYTTTYFSITFILQSCKLLGKPNELFTPFLPCNVHNLRPLDQ